MSYLDCGNDSDSEPEECKLLFNISNLRGNVQILFAFVFSLQNSLCINLDLYDDLLHMYDMLYFMR